MFTGITLGAICQIILIDLVLSGDNAVVIAMAARSLPERQQRQAIFWGGAAAIGLRVAMTAVVAFAMQVPLLQLAGGLLLCWIALRLLVSGENEGTSQVKAAASLRDAVVTIVMADFVMSLDNMLAVGGAAHGSMLLLMMGLLFSMAIIMFASSHIAGAMNRAPWLVYVGAGILTWTAGSMIVDDRWLHRLYTPGHAVAVGLQIALTAGVLGAGYLLNRRGEQGA